jgi:hypothetical protein
VNPTTNYPDEAQAVGSCSFTLHGLPIGISTSDLCVAVGSSSDFIEARLLAEDARGIPGYISARMLFSTRAGAEKAKVSVEAILKIVSAGFPVRAEIDLDSNPESPSNGVPARQPERNKRHRFSQEDKTYLAKQFEVNSRPTAPQRRIFAAELGVDEKQIQTWFNNQRQRQKREDMLTGSPDQSREISADPAANNPNPNANSTAPIPISRKRLSQQSMKAKNFSTSPIERFRASPPGCEGEPSLELIAAAAKMTTDTPLPDKAADTGRELSKDNVYLPSQATYSREIVTRRSYARSVASGGSGRSRRSARSAGGGISGNTIASGASMSSFASNMSHTSNIPRVSRISRVVNKARHGSKKMIRRTRAKVITAVCARPEPVLDQEMFPEAPEGPQMNIQATIALTCDSCDHVSEIQVGDSQSCNFYCAGCQNYLGQYRMGLVKISMTFNLCCRGCLAWVETTISNEYMQENVDFKENHHVCCNKCQEHLFEATISSSRRFYDCTFCRTTFLSKFGWWRHENTLHHQKEVWVCRLDEVAPLGLFWSCAFCEQGLQLDPFMPYHGDGEHRFRHCKDQGKCFGRKDELVQHLRGFHRYSKRELPSVETWTRTVEQPDMVWKCGVCNLTFTEWFVRLNHIGKHWDAGLTMRDWNSQHEERETGDETGEGDESRAASKEPNQSPTIDGSQILPLALQTDSAMIITQRTDMALPHTSPVNTGPSHFNAAATYASVVSSGFVPTQSQPESVVSGIWGKVKSVARGLGSASGASYAKNGNAILSKS